MENRPPWRMKVSQNRSSQSQFAGRHEIECGVENPSSGSSHKLAQTAKSKESKKPLSRNRSRQWHSRKADHIRECVLPEQRRASDRLVSEIGVREQS